GANSAESLLVRVLRQTELELNLHIDSIGISVINRCNEEIVYLFMQRILLEARMNPAECQLHCVVQNFQVDNQLRHCEKEVLLHVGNLSDGQSEGSGSSQQLVPHNSSSSSIPLPSITFIAHKLFIP